MMSYFCYQGNDSDCGFASLKMLLAILSKDRNYLFLKKPSNKKSHFTIADLIKIGKGQGLELEPYKVDSSGLLGMKTPFLALLSNNHMVLIKSIKKKSVLVHDPAIGKRRIKKDKLVKEFAGYVIQAGTIETLQKCKDKEETILPIWRNVVQYAFVSLIGAFLMIGFYLLEDANNFVLLIVFLVTIAISELVENWYLIKNIKYFDNKFLAKFFKDKINRNKDRYGDYIEFKKTYFESNKSLALSLLLFFVLSVLLVLNDYHNLLVLVLILVVMVVGTFFSEKHNNALISEINELEAKAFKDKDETTDTLLLANEKADRYATRIGVRKCIYAFVVAMLAIFMMVIDGTYTTNYVLFHFGAYYVISNSFGGVINYIANSKKLRKLTARFLDSCDL